MTKDDEDEDTQPIGCVRGKEKHSKITRISTGPKSAASQRLVIGRLLDHKGSRAKLILLRFCRASPQVFLRNNLTHGQMAATSSLGTAAASVFHLPRADYCS